MKTRVVFRADASKEIGLGHFIRSLSLAQMLAGDFDCLFATVEPSEFQRCEVAKVCQLLALPKDNADVVFLNNLHPSDIVVLDNYFFNECFQRHIKGIVRSLVYIDDLHNQHYVADLVINHGIEDVSLYDCEVSTKLCLGLDWALLRPPFLEKLYPRVRNRENPNVIVCMGGSDPFNLNEKIVSLLQSNQLNIKKLVVLGGGDFKMEKEILPFEVSLMAGLNAVEIKKMLLWADLGFFSASTICMEALSLQLPSVVGYYVDNQRGFYDYISGRNWIEGIGNWKDIQSLPVRRIKVFQPDFSGLSFKGIKERYVQVFKNL